MRTLAGMRGFARYLERNGKGKVGALAAVRAPKIGKTLPRPLPRRRRHGASPIPSLPPATSASRGLHARDAAVLALALRQRACAFPKRSGCKRADFGGARDAITVTGKGRKQRMVPVLPQVQKLDRRLCRALSLRSARTTARCSSAPRAARCRRASCSWRWRGCAARSACRDGDAARAAAFLRHAPLGARRRSARDPGTARPRLAGDDADLHRSRRRAPDRGLSQRPSARVANFDANRHPGVSVRA